MHMPAIPRIVTSEICNEVDKRVVRLVSIFAQGESGIPSRAATNEATAKEADMSISVKKEDRRYSAGEVGEA